MSIEILCSVLFPGLIAVIAGQGLQLNLKWGSLAGGMLAGLATLVILPELMEGFPLSVALSAYAFGILFVYLVDRLVKPVCPECGGEEGWWRLLPLLSALAVHGLIDGAMIGIAKPSSMSSWILVLHRVPETFAILALLESVGISRTWVRWQIAGLQLVALGGWMLAGLLNAELLRLGQGIIGGVLLYLGLHQLHHAWEEKSMDWRAVAAGVGCVGIVHWIAA
jgi:zinc transporter ZupT